MLRSPAKPRALHLLERFAEKQAYLPKVCSENMHTHENQQCAYKCDSWHQKPYQTGALVGLMCVYVFCPVGAFFSLSFFFFFFSFFP